MTGDGHEHTDGVRKPDPTLGKNPRGQWEPAAVEPVPPAPGEQGAASAEPHAKPRRKRVVLSDPRQQTNSLRTRVELEEQTSWGELLIKDLVKRQLGVAMLLATLVLVVFGALPLAFYLAPGFASARVLGLPLAWVLLGAVPFPLLLGVGLLYNRLAARYERDFVNMIER